MSIYNKLDKLLKINKMSIGHLSKLSGVPVSTIYSLKARNSNRTDISVLKKLADALGVNINYFASDYESDSVKLTKEEAEFILKMRSLDAYGKSLLYTVLIHETERVEKNVEINYSITADGKEELKHTSVDIDELAAAFNKLV